MRISAAVGWLLLSPGFIFSFQLFEPAEENLRAIRNDADSVRVAWVKQYAGNNSSAKSVVDRYGNLYVTGKAFDRNENPGFLTIKYAASGKEQWVAWHNGAGDFVDAIAHIALDSSGNVYVAGSSPGDNGRDDYVTVKYNAAGKLQWSKRYDSPFKHHDHIMALAVDPPGNAYVTGNSFSSENWDWVTIKYNAAGVEQWAVRRNGSANNSWDEAAALAVDRAGNVYVTGTSLLGDASTHYVTIKYNPAGDQEWSAQYDRAVLEVPRGVPKLAVDAAGNVYLAGAGSCASGNGDALAVKYDRHGAQLWTACYNSPTPGSDYFSALTLDDSSNLYVAGAGVSASGSDFLTVKYDRAGKQKWLERFTAPASKFNSATDLAIDRFGQVYVTGFSTADPGGKFVTVKYVQQDTATRYYLYQNFPNPFNAFTTIRFAVPRQVYVKLTIYDLLGREVARLVDEELIVGEYEKIWHGASLAKAGGALFMRMQTPEFAGTKKLLRLK